MAKNKVLVPRTKIPQVNPLCTACGSGTKAAFGTAFAEGYHRRHVCIACTYGFYTLAPYDGDSYRISPLPFKDRELTPAELAEREQWWTEFNEGNQSSPLPREVSAPETVHRMLFALQKKPQERTPIDKMLVAGYEVLNGRLKLMEAALLDAATHKENADGQ
jgi:hypothetical protein